MEDVDEKVKEIFDYIEIAIEEGELTEDIKTDINQICEEIYNDGYDSGMDWAEK